jgi:hypothetical protein
MIPRQLSSGARSDGDRMKNSHVLSWTSGSRASYWSRSQGVERKEWRGGGVAAEEGSAVAN